MDRLVVAFTDGCNGCQARETTVQGGFLTFVDVKPLDSLNEMLGYSSAVAVVTEPQFVYA